MTDTVQFNPFEPGFLENPYPAFAELRENDPVHHTPLDFWLLLRHRDVEAFLRDPALSVEDRNARPTPIVEMARSLIGDRVDYGSQSMLNRDPPDHTRLRKLVSQAFTPRRLEGLRDRVQQIVDESLDSMAGTTSADVIADLAFPVPFTVICEMLGMPSDNRDDVRAWSHLIVRSLEPMVEPDVIVAIADATDAMRAFLLDVIAHKRRAPADDMLSHMIAAEEQGDVLTDEELLEQVMLLFIAGHETTVNLIGNGTLALLRNPAEMDRLRRDPSLEANAIEELLRYDSPVQLSRRITLADTTVDGHLIGKGSFVVTVLASANRDPERWGPAADTVDIGRADAGEHVSFGGGAHYCMGAALARIEGRTAIGSLIRRFPNLDLAGDPVWNGRLNLRGLERLPVSL